MVCREMERVGVVGGAKRDNDEVDFGVILVDFGVKTGIGVR